MLPETPDFMPRPIQSMYVISTHRLILSSLSQPFATPRPSKAPTQSTDSELLSRTMHTHLVNQTLRIPDLLSHTNAPIP